MFSPDRVRRPWVVSMWWPVCLCVFSACSTDPVDDFDLGTVDGACEAVTTAIAMLESESTDEQSDGRALAERVWSETEDNVVVVRGMRDECPVEVLDMLDTASIPFNTWD